LAGACAPMGRYPGGRSRVLIPKNDESGVVSRELSKMKGGTPVVVKDRKGVASAMWKFRRKREDLRDDKAIVGG